MSTNEDIIRKHRETLHVYQQAVLTTDRTGYDVIEAQRKLSEAQAQHRFALTAVEVADVNFLNAYQEYKENNE